jgi:hypothetical protein
VDLSNKEWLSAYEVAKILDTTRPRVLHMIWPAELVQEVKGTREQRGSWRLHRSAVEELLKEEAKQRTKGKRRRS